MQVKYHSSPNVFPFWNLQSYLILPPALWLFVQFTTNHSFKYHKKYLLLFVPAGLELMVRSAEYVRFRLTGQDINLLQIKVWFFCTEILPILGMVVVLFIYGKKLVTFFKQLKEFSSTPPRVYVFKLYSLFLFLTVLTLLWIAGVIIELPIFKLLEGVLAVFLFALGYIGYFKPTFFEVPTLTKVKLAEVTSFPNYHDQQELKRLAGLFEQKAIHTRSKLSLEELAAELKLPARYVSYLINTYHQTNFHYFVNSYRVKEVIRKINSPAEQHKTLLALALESGFNSKSTFNEVFKNHTGQSPSQYLQTAK